MTEEDRIESLLGLVDDLKQRVEALERHIAELRPKFPKWERMEDPGTQMQGAVTYDECGQQTSGPWQEKDFEGH